MIGYEPPANSTPDPNVPQDGNTTVDTGIPVISAAVVKGCFCTLIISSYRLSTDEVVVKWVMDHHQMGTKVTLQAPPHPLFPSTSSWAGRRNVTD